MDEIDYRILRELQFNARIANVQLAERVGLSPSPCWNRLRHLEAQGVIENYRTIFSQAALGMPDTAIIEGEGRATRRCDSREVREGAGAAARSRRVVPRDR